MKLLKPNNNELLNDLKNVKKQNNYFLKMKDCFKGCDLNFCLNIKQTKSDKMKVCVRIKQNGFAGINDDGGDMIGFIKNEISFDLLKELI